MSDTRLPLTKSGRPSTARIQVLSCGCICRTYDGKMVVVNATCKHHRVHPDFREAAR